MLIETALTSYVLLTAIPGDNVPKYIGYDKSKETYVVMPSEMLETTKTLTSQSQNEVASITAQGTDNSTFKSESYERSEEHRLNCSQRDVIIKFGHDSTNIVEPYRLNSFLIKAKECGFSVLAISGYASPDGELNHNLDLAKRRAYSVQNYIQSNFSASFQTKVQNPLQNQAEIKNRTALIENVDDE